MALMYGVMGSHEVDPGVNSFDPKASGMGSWRLGLRSKPSANHMAVTFGEMERQKHFVHNTNIRKGASEYQL
jgi:hypothetical protein